MANWIKYAQWEESQNEIDRYKLYKSLLFCLMYFYFILLTLPEGQGHHNSIYTNHCGPILTNLPVSFLCVKKLAYQEETNYI